MTIRQSGAYRHLKVVSTAYSRNRVRTSVQKLGGGCVDCVQVAGDGVVLSTFMTGSV